jgi:hypothetical protein
MWKKSSYSAGQGACVAVTQFTDGRVGVKHSINETIPITFTPREWEAFIAGVKASEFDLPARCWHTEE